MDISVQNVCLTSFASAEVHGPVALQYAGTRGDQTAVLGPYANSCKSLHASWLLTKPGKVPTLAKGVQEIYF